MEVVVSGMVLVVTITICFIMVLLYRGFRRAAVMRELYGVDTAEFHTFTDDECVH